MHFTVVALLVSLAAAAPATLEARQCPAGAHGALCPASAPAGAVCCYDDVVGKCDGPGKIYNVCRSA
ncbi:hypothetical protein CDV31_016975 [Fusarium ambrosium]|uniref:Uncharacterized protein n=1 Tax=Fusarium ambrosium TaxID=131363 RepID=A0A428RWV9_9HYPO|nr:hypothetical protein CDV31_016975 [Fusarium ambrosium]